MSDAPHASEIVLDLSAVLGEAPAQQTLRSVIDRVELIVDGNRQARDITGAESQVAFDVSLAPGSHDFEARVLSNTDVVLAEGSAPDVLVSAAGFEVPIQMSAVTGVLFVLPGDVAVGGSASATVLLDNRGSQDLLVTVGPLSPPADSCDGQIPCVSVFGFEGPFTIGPGSSRDLSVHAGPDGQTTFSLRLTASAVGFVDLPISVTAPGVGTITVLMTVDQDPVGGTTATVQGPLTRSALTNANGLATFTDLPLGSWTVSVPEYGVQRTVALSYGGDGEFVGFNVIGLGRDGGAGG